MLPAALVLGAALAYLLLLFAVAAFGDRRAAQGRSIIDNAWVYSLSMAVYCTAWTYFGSVGRAASEGVWFLPIYLGPMLAMLLGWLILRRMIRIAHTYRITSIADFIASRYGKSPSLAALVTLITVVGIVPYIALQLKAISAGYQVLTMMPGEVIHPPWWRDGTLVVTLALAAFTIVFGTRHLDTTERHEGMVAAIALESIVKIIAFLAVGVFVTWGLFDGMADIWARAQEFPELRSLLRIDDGSDATTSFGYAQWFGLTVLAMLSLLMLPRQFQVAVVECVNEHHLARAVWVFPLYLLIINLFVLPIAIGGQVLFGPGSADPDGFVLSLPLASGWPGLALFAYIGGLSAATGMLIVETIAVSTMVCNDLVMPALLRLRIFAAGRLHAGTDSTGLLLRIRRLAIVAVLLLGYLYFRLAGEAYALVSIGLISFAAVAQFAPALLGGMYWRGGTRLGALAGLLGGFALWVWTLMLPSLAKSGWMAADYLERGPWGIELLAPERLFGLSGLDSLSHSLFWSLLVNVALYFGISLARAPSAREASQALLFVDIFERDSSVTASAPVFWRGHARLDDLNALAERFLGAQQARALFEELADAQGLRHAQALVPDAWLVHEVETRLAGAVGSTSARVLIASVAQEEALDIDDLVEILEEASQLRVYARALEDKSRSLEQATAELRAANEQLKSLDQLKDDFMSSVTHELRTPLTSIRALAELMLDTPDMEDAERDRFLDIIVGEAERLGRLVNQVLDLAKIESGHAEWHNTELDLAELVRRAELTTHELFRERSIAIELDLEGDLPMIWADADRLTQVIINLLANAAKFAPSPGGRVRAVLCREPGALRFEVHDNGPGVAAELADTIFEKFRQVGDAMERPPGTGLGLPISRQIIDHFGGQLWLMPTEEGGACFAFRLPLGATPAPSADAGGAGSAPGAPPRAEGGETDGSEGPDRG